MNASSSWLLLTNRFQKLHCKYKVTFKRKRTELNRQNTKRRQGMFKRNKKTQPHSMLRDKQNGGSRARDKDMKQSEAAVLRNH